MTSASGSAVGLSVSATMPRMGLEASQIIKVGFLAPLSGNVSAWGEPGLNGCLIWADWINSLGGIKIGRERFKVEIVAYDNEYDPDKALLGLRKLISEDNVQFIMMLGGDTLVPAVQEVINRRKMLVSTLLPSDLSPNTPYIIAPCEVHPIYNVTAVEWLKETYPELKTVAMCAQNDALGVPSVATYRAAFEAAEIDVVNEIFFPVTTDDFKPIIDEMLAKDPDILCWDTAYEPFVHALTKEAYHQGFQGQILSCTCDNYQQLIDETSKEFMEGFVFQFPDFDDPALNDTRVNLTNPNEFFEEFNSRYPGMWTAVSWEYVSILELWKEAVSRAGTFEPLSALAAMKAGGSAKHAFGEARWWGKELFGVNNALVGDWPVVVIRDGKARIAAFRSITSWWDKHSSKMIKHMRDLGQMWDQKEKSSLGETG
jgi:branched-chain amino acid transport system substrate-binding protein